MYGKHFASMYTGSMMGSGALVFAVMGYIISHMRPDSEVGFQVELNPKLMAALIGEEEVDVVKTIEEFCSPDLKSRTKDEEGRRLIRLGEFDYRVVNGAKYDLIRNEQARRKQNREAQQRWRDKRKAARISAGNNGNQNEHEKQEEVRKEYPHDPIDQKTIRNDLRAAI